MKPFQLLLIPGLVAAWLVSSPGEAVEPDPTVESVFAKWEEASQKCRTLDAKMTVLYYDHVFGNDQPKTKQGRFYFESPGFTRYELSEDQIENRHDSPRASEAFVWTGEGLFVMDHRNRTCMFWSSKTIQTVRQQIARMPEQTWWNRFCKGYASSCTWPAKFSKPDEFMPLLLTANTQTQRNRFDFKVERREGRIVLEATPKQKGGDLREIDVMLDADSYQFIAHRVISVSGDRTVHVFDNVKINSEPSDRDISMRPVPFGYQLVQVDDSLFGKN